MLHQNTIGLGESADGYALSGPNLGDSSFVLTMQARLNSEEGGWSGNHYGAAVVIIGSSGLEMGLALGTNDVMTTIGASNINYSYNTSQFNTYTLTYNSNTNIDTIAVNGQVLYTGPASLGYNAPNHIFFGDCTNGPNANADYASFSFVQTDAAPIPATVWLFGSGLVSLIGIKRKYLG
jgi:hypothetical protein